MSILLAARHVLVGFVASFVLLGLIFGCSPSTPAPTPHPQTASPHYSPTPTPSVMLPPPASGSHTVEWSASGTAVISLAYGPQSWLRTATVRSPFDVTSRATDTDLRYLSMSVGDATTEGGPVGCTITVDGARLADSNAAGIATCTVNRLMGVE